GVTPSAALPSKTLSTTDSRQALHRRRLYLHQLLQRLRLQRQLLRLQPLRRRLRRPHRDKLRSVRVVTKSRADTQWTSPGARRTGVMSTSTATARWSPRPPTTVFTPIHRVAVAVPRTRIECATRALKPVLTTRR